MEDLEVKPGVVIPGSEIHESRSRASGPGGQHVNTTATRVTLRWNVEETSLPTVARERILEKLASRLTNRGELVIHADRSRSQHRNREEARERLAATVRAALHRPTRRFATKPTRASQRRRVKAKKRAGERKRLRGRVRED